MAEEKKLKDLLSRISPFFINPKKNAVTIGFSNRFFLFQLIQTLTRRIEDDPYLNFISALKHYKVLGEFLHGDIRRLYKDRNKSYLKNFFPYEDLYKYVKEDLEWVYARNDKLKITITKRGVIIYENYKKNNFNILLLTVHSGTFMPNHIAKKQTLTAKKRVEIEDTNIHKIYGDLVLKKNGIWIDTKFSRFACDYNRPYGRAIYSDNSEPWVGKLWKEPLTQAERKWLMKGYNDFYFTLSKLVDSYRFNIIFDGHSMKDHDTRPEISFGTKYVPKFYMPVVRSMRNKMRRLGYGEVAINKPFSGGNILKWLNQRFPDVFIFSMEINKKLYINKAQTKSIKYKINNIIKNLMQIFDIEDEEGESM